MAKARSGPLGLAAVVPAPFGGIGVRIADGLITELVYLPPKFGAFAARERVATRAAKQLAHYLVDPDYRFDLPLAPAGTPYQQRVWTAISEIPRGQVRSYGALARMLRSGPRAVGQACGANWYPVIVPCHRVVAAEGLGGFSGIADRRANEASDEFHLGVKRWLLRHEGVNA